ncbi:MAG: molybdopterin-guanine dinucleotide biosynthesis protein B [Chloroflexi bacterium RBG_13_51_52]|nr:MAG: molybdopterin-guanine dinucleotide biosynthesis protein B [Chloroflexi bacterium RBG_13_51_52]
MRSIISIVGKSSSGKTTLLEALIAELKKRGYKVAIVKHSHHKDDLDTAAKDTWRFTKAGSELSVINSLDHLAIYRRMDDYFDPKDISNFVLWDFDILLTEGFKGSNYPKIEVHRNEQGQELLTDPKLLLAVVTDTPLDISVPQFSHDDVSGIADIIEKTIVSQNDETDVSLVINGTHTPVSPYLKDWLTRTLSAMIPSLQNNGEVKNLHISLRRKH